MQYPEYFHHLPDSNIACIMMGKTGGQNLVMRRMPIFYCRQRAMSNPALPPPIGYSPQLAVWFSRVFPGIEVELCCSLALVDRPVERSVNAPGLSLLMI